MGRHSEMESLSKRAGASEVARKRLKWILLSLTGEFSVQEAFEALGISRTRFQDLRRMMLEAAVAALEMGAPGRPRGRRRTAARELLELRDEVSTLRHELRLSRAKLIVYDTELGVVPRVGYSLHEAGGGV